MPGERAPEEFAVVLRAAVAARGLSLDQIRRALHRRDVRVSVATLSYWQSGRSLPERASSLAAIGPLEDVLDLPRGFLGSRLPRSRRFTRDPADYDRGCPLVSSSDGHGSHVEEAVRQVGLDYAHLTWTGVHDRFRLDAGGFEVDHEVRLLLAARQEGVDRYPVWMESDDPGTFPVVTAMTNVRVGRIREFPQYNGLAVEMLLDRPLGLGETTLVEHRQRFVGPQEQRTWVNRRARTPFREIVFVVDFDPALVPSRIRRVTVVGDDRREEPIAPYPTVQALFTDGQPGTYEIAWEW